MKKLSIFDENGRLKSNEEIEKIQFLQVLEKNPEIVDLIANNVSGCPY